MNQKNYEDFRKLISDQPLVDLITKIKTGEGKVSGDDFRHLAEREKIPSNLRLLVLFAADLLDEREYWGRDSLTGLMNSSRLGESVAGVFIRLGSHPEEKFTLILYDLDSLKKANNMGEGHRGGDRLVMSFASSLKQVYGSRTDMIGRWRVGDEFMVGIKGDKTETGKLAEKLSQKLKSKKIMISHKPVKLSATYVIKELDIMKDLRKQISALSVELLKKKNASQK